MIYIYYFKKILLHRPNWRDIWTCYGHAHAAAAQQKYGVWWGDKWHAPIKATSCYNSSHTRIELQAAAARGWTAAGRHTHAAAVQQKDAVWWSDR